VERRHDGRRRAFALHGGVGYDHAGDRATTMDDGHDVVKRGPIGARHDRDTGRKHWQRSLSLQGKKAFRLELLVDLLERLAPQTVARRFDAQDSQLKLTTSRIHGEFAERDDRHALVRRGERAARVGRPHHAADLRVGILQREVPVTVAVLLEPHDFASHPQWLDGPLDDVTRRQCQRGDRDRRLGRKARLSRLGSGASRASLGPRGGCDHRLFFEERKDFVLFGRRGWRWATSVHP
jgi:hypothetical protein